MKYVVLLPFCLIKLIFTDVPRMVCQHTSATAWSGLFAAGFAALLLASFSSRLQAQSQEYRFERLSVADGLSQNSALALLYDRQGFLWMGTYDGLNRYDGTGFRVFRSSRNDSTSLAKNWVTALAEDTHGMMWVGTNGAGLSRYDPRTERFRTITSNPRNFSSLPSNAITALLSDSALGILWIGTDNGLASLHLASGAITRFSSDPQNPASLPGIAITALYKDYSTGRLWIGTRSGIAVWNPPQKQTAQGQTAQKQSVQGQFVQYNLPDSIAQIPGVKNIYTFCLDRQGTMWVGTKSGLVRLDNAKTPPSPAGVIAREVRYYNNFIEVPATSSVNSVFEDSKGRLWVGTKFGLCLFDRAAGRAVRFRHNDNEATSLSDDFIGSICEDSAGILWVGTSNGLNKLDALSQRFPVYYRSPQSLPELANNSISAFCEDSDGALWIGSDEGINVWQRRTGAMTLISQQTAPVLPADRIKSICRDSTGTLWIGTDKGLASYNSSSKRWNSFAKELSDKTIACLTADNFGRVWVGTTEGLSEYNIQKATWRHYAHNPANPLSLSNNLIFGIVVNSDGTVWVGTDGGGLNLLDPRTGRVQAFLRHKAEDSSSLASDYILFLGEDRQHGNLLIGTDGGVSIMNKATGRIRSYTLLDGLPNEIINAILADDKGRYWISTNRGITCLDVASGQVRNYSADDGLQSDEFTTNAALVGSDKTLYFGGIYGFNAFYPDSIQRNNYAPRVVITGLKKFNKPIVLDSSLVFAQTLTLPYSDNTITLEFAALGFSFPERNRYAYKLEGFDEDWIDAGTKHEATYTNLDGGDYVFTVKAANSDGVWSSHRAILRLVVVPPWWRSLWFRVISSVCLLGITIYLLRRRLISDKVQNIELERLVRKRTRELERVTDNLSAANEEIKCQLEIREQQNVEIESANMVLQETNAQLERSYDTVQKLSELGQKITAALNTERIASLAFVSFYELLDTTSFIIQTLSSKDTNTLETIFCVESGFRHQTITPALERSMHYISESGKQRREIIIHDLDEETLLQQPNSSDNSSLPIDRMRSLVAIPLMLEGNLIGVVSVQSVRANTYSKYDLDVIRVLSSYLAIALENARAFKAVEELNSDKNMLLGVVAHDLKTPLAGIMIAASTIHSYFERYTKEQIQHKISQIISVADNMTRLITDLLDVSAIESGQISLENENIDVQALVQRCVEQQRSQADKKHIRFVVQALGENLRVTADANRFEQVLGNLISNALKFSPMGTSITISIGNQALLEQNSEHYAQNGASTLPSTAARGTNNRARLRRNDVFIAIGDEGPGLSDEDKTKLFGKFARLSARPTGGEHSSGLGLAIVKKLVEAMNGQVWCESEIGEGALFVVALPAS